MKEKESNNNGFAVIGIIVFLLCLWDFTGMMDGHSFVDGAGNSITGLGCQ
jgi:hypothetical protein